MPEKLCPMCNQRVWVDKEDDAPDTPRGRDRLFNMTKFIEDFMMFDKLCNDHKFDTSESISLYNCFITNELREVLE